jgi:predicted O-linked N-acetylglucosamine transferase (SPINDLY family)
MVFGIINFYIKLYSSKYYDLMDKITKKMKMNKTNHITYDTAVSLCEQGNLTEGLKMFKQLPLTDEVLYAIATCHKDMNNLSDMMTSKNMFTTLLKKHKLSPEVATRVNINYVSVITMLSKYYIDHGEYHQAVAVTKQGTQIFPNDPTLIYNLGHMYKCLGQYDTAIHYLVTALSLGQNQTLIDIYYELINIYQDRGDLINTLKYINLGLTKVDNKAGLYNALGLYYIQSDYRLANEAFHNALHEGNDDPPMLAKIHTNIGHLYSVMGQVDESLKHFEKAFTINPTDTLSRQNYVMNLLYSDKIEYKTIIRKHLEIGNFLQKSHRQPPFAVPEYHNTKIHLGYVSGDFFGTHPMTHFLHTLLTQYTGSKYEIYCYCISDTGDTSNYSEKIYWRSIKYLSLEGCIKRVIQDKIDVLIDLSGHTGSNRMDLFANRVAKLQLSYLGYPCITGMPEIDYYVIDQTFNNKFKTASLPHCFTHYTIPFIPSDLKLPYHSNESHCITFGSLNKPNKINDGVAQLWDHILGVFPNSRLILKKIGNYQFKNADRVITIAITSKYEDYLQQYNMIDIALDTFPYAGTTTTCEALLMGTPVVTLADRQNHTIHQNTTASLLINSGLDHLVATTPDQLMEIIQKTITTIEANPDYKNQIQSKFLNGNVTNSAQYINDFEQLIPKLLTNYI